MPKKKKGKNNSVLSNLIQNTMLQNDPVNLGNLQALLGNLGQTPNERSNTMQSSVGNLSQVQDVLGNLLQNTTGNLGQLPNIGNTLQNTTGNLGQLQNISNLIPNTTGSLGQLQNTLSNLNILNLVSTATLLETLLSRVQENTKKRKSNNKHKNESSSN